MSPTDPAPTVVAYGERALLVTGLPADAVLAVDAAIARTAAAGRLPGVVETVPGAGSVLVVLADPAAASAASRPLREVVATPPPRDLSRTVADRPPVEVEVEVEVPTVYDGADLDAVADATGWSVEEVVARHTAPTYRVAFGGFAPGFAYLAGLDAGLRLPRRDRPRPRVPAGSVAIAGDQTAIYPAASPGGWHLLGRTELAVWDLDRDPPALLVPGTEVRFTAVRR